MTTTSSTFETRTRHAAKMAAKREDRIADKTKHTRHVKGAPFASNARTGQAFTHPARLLLRYLPACVVRGKTYRFRLQSARFMP